MDNLLTYSRVGKYLDMRQCEQDVQIGDYIVDTDIFGPATIYLYRPGPLRDDEQEQILTDIRTAFWLNEDNNDQFSVGVTLAKSDIDGPAGVDGPTWIIDEAIEAESPWGEHSQAYRQN